LGTRTLRQLRATDRSGGSTFNKGKGRVDKSKPGKKIFITNNLPYAKRLNEGWSTQAPANFVQAAIRRALK